MLKRIPPLNRGWPTIVIVNESSNIATSRLRKAVAAIQMQVDRHFFPAWGWRARLRVGRKVPPRTMSVTLRDFTTSGDEGYHVDALGIPSALVFTHETRTKPYAPQEVFATLSHEVLEMIADPALNLYASAYHEVRRRRHRVFIGIEVCDPVQFCLYKVKGIQVSDFVVPEWFESERPAGSMRFSFKNNVSAPLELAKGGYMDLVVKGRLQQLGGDKRRARHRMRARARMLGQ